MNSDFRFSKHAEERLTSRGLKIAESDEEKPGIIIDYDADGGIVGLEVLNASTKMDQANSVIYEVA